MMRVLAGEAVWPPPVWLMRQAGRYLPEYRAIRAQAGDFITLCTSPALAAEVTMQPLRRFGMDAAILFSDILMVPWALGQALRFAEGEGPLLDPVRDTAALTRLDLARLPDAIAPILETLRLVRPQVGDSTLIGFAGAPFTVACYMVEGSGSKDFSVTRRMAYAESALFADLMALLEEATVTYLLAQVAAGAESVMLFDSWAGILPPPQFGRHVTGPAARIAARLRAAHPEVPIIGFPRLAGQLLGRYAAATLVNAVGMDTATDPALAAREIPDSVALQGNLDPLALLAGGTALHEAVAPILAAMHGRPFVFNLGHGILPATPPEHVAALLEQVRAA